MGYLNNMHYQQLLAKLKGTKPRLPAVGASLTTRGRPTNGHAASPSKRENEAAKKLTFNKVMNIFFKRHISDVYTLILSHLTLLYLSHIKDTTGYTADVERVVEWIVLELRLERIE